MKFIKTIILSSSVVFLCSCSDEEIEEDSTAVEEVPVILDTVTLERVQRVSNNLVHNDNDGVSITTGPGRKKFINISLYQSNVNEDYAITSTSNSDPAIAVAASWDGVSFIQSEQHSTNVSFEIISIDSDNLLAAVKFSALLVNPETDEMLLINESTLEIGGLNFNTLTQGQLAH